MPNRTGTRLRNGKPPASSPWYSPTSKTSSYTPPEKPSPSSRGSSVRPPSLVRAVLRSSRAPVSRSIRCSSILIPAAGRPRAVSRTCVVRRPAICSLRPLHGSFYQAERLARSVEDLALVLHPERRQAEGQVMHVRQREVYLLHLVERGEHRLAHPVQGIMRRRAVVISKGLEYPPPDTVPAAVELNLRGAIRPV